MKKIFALSFIFISSISISQEMKDDTINKKDKSKLISIGTKLGVPNLISFNGEIIIPLLDNHIAPYIDYGSLNLDVEEIETSINYLEYGVNFYFSNKGKGLYASAGMAKLKSEFSFNDLTFEENGVTQKGSARTDLDLNTLNLKLGFKTGGLIFLRVEVGYGMGSIPDSLNFTATSNGITETFSEEIPPIPGLNSEGLLIGNIGLGISF
jgi:hypothetical protein